MFWSLYMEHFLVWGRWELCTSSSRPLSTSHCNFLSINLVYQSRKEKKSHYLFLWVKKEFIAPVYYNNLTSVSFNKIPWLHFLSPGSKTASSSKFQCKFFFRNQWAVWAIVIKGRNVFIIFLTDRVETKSCKLKGLLNPLT